MRMRVDIWATVMASAIVMVGSYELLSRAVKSYNTPPEEPVVQVQQEPEPGEVGTAAPDDLPRASTVAEIRSQQGLFTIEVPKRDIVSVPGTGFYYIRLADGDTVLLKLDRDAVQESGRESDFLCVLPVGQLVEEPVPEDVVKSTAGSGVTNTDFFIQMEWEKPVAEAPPPPPPRKELDGEAIARPVSLALMAATFALMRIILVRKGIFPPILPRKAKPEP